MKLDLALNFINNFKINMTKNSVLKGFYMNLIIVFFILILLSIQPEIINIIICSSITFLNLVMIIFLCSKKKWSFRNSFLISSINLSVTVIFLNYLVYGFQKYLNRYSVLFFIVYILIEIIITILIAIFKYKTIINDNTKKYNSIPSYAGIVGFTGYILAKNFLSGSSESVGSIIFTVCTSIIILASLYSIVGQLLPRYYLIKKFNITGYQSN